MVARRKGGGPHDAERLLENPRDDILVGKATNMFRELLSMNVIEERRGRRARSAQMVAIALLFAASAALGIVFNAILKLDVIYTHFFYIPIVLASMWWGRKGILVSGLMAVLVFSFHLFGYGTATIAIDVARTAFFVAVAFFVGTLREKVLNVERALHQSEQKYRGLIDKSIAGIFVCRNETILFANSRMGAILGYGTGELAGKPLSDLVFLQDRSKLKGFSAMTGGDGDSPNRCECRFVRKDGRLVWVDAASSLTEYEGESALLVNLYNITKGKEAEEKHRELSALAREQEAQLVHSTRLAELGEMAAGISHEINQPLTGIRNFAKNALYMIENGAGAIDDVAQNLRLISDQVDRASKIINKMREITRRSELHFTEFDVNSVLRESVEFMLPQMKLAGVKVALDLEPALPPVRGDRIRLEQVFLNILTNAKQAMESVLERQLSVRSHHNAEGACPVVVEIEDTGDGFDPKDTDKLFTPFYTTKAPGQGTGLGLSISLNIVKEHGGFIKAEGRPGKGALFTVGFPGGRTEKDG
jgi:histidine kinase